MTYVVKWSGKFKKSYKLANKRGLDISLLINIVDKLKNGVPLEGKYRDHELRVSLLVFENVIYNQTGY